MPKTFELYNKTDEEAEADGYESGLNWPAHWNHVPGGPYVPDVRPYERDEKWVAYCETRRRHRELYLKGWHRGFAKAAENKASIRRLRNKLVMNKIMAA